MSWNGRTKPSTRSATAADDDEEDEESVESDDEEEEEGESEGSEYMMTRRPEPELEICSTIKQKKSHSIFVNRTAQNIDENTNTRTDLERRHIRRAAAAGLMSV